MDSAVELVLKNHDLIHGILRILQLYQVFKMHGPLLTLTLCSIFPQPVQEPRWSAVPIEMSQFHMGATSALAKDHANRWLTFIGKLKY